MKRILCFIDSLVAGGAQRQLVGLAALLQKNGYKVKVITYYDLPFYLPFLKEHQVDYELVSCKKQLLSRLTNINKSIKSFSPDVVISYLDTPNIIACILKICRPKWKLIVSERNTTQTLSKRDKVKFFLYKYADCIVSNSYSQGDFISINYPHLKKKCTVITNYVDTKVFSPVEKKEDGDVTRIIGVGRIAHQKNIPVLIKALKIVCEKGYNVRVDWYGNQFDSYDESMSLISRYNLHHYFEFHKPFNPIWEKYHESDIFVLPSFYEGFPNVLCEAMSCGLISIASDVCDNGYIIMDGVNGFLFPSGDVNRLAECIQKVVSLSKGEQEAISEACRSRAIKYFSEGEFIKKYMSLI